MWTIGEIDGYEFQIKHFEEPSEEYGINRGKISKLYISKNRKCLVDYDRGWHVPPTKELKPLFDMLIAMFN